MTSSEHRAPALPEDLVAARPWLVPGRHAWIALGPGDEPLVAPGDTVTPVTVAAQRVRDPHVVRVPVRDGRRFPAGSPIAPADVRSWLRRNPLGGEGRVLYRASGGRANVVVGRLHEPVHARVDGTVEAVGPGGISVRLAGPSLPAIASVGQTVFGRLRIAVGEPGNELRSGGLHVADAGSIVVAGARVDVETLTRARALGINGVITGGIAGQDLRAFAQSEARQRAALHPVPGFAVLVLEGYGRRSLAGPPWDLLLAAAGTSVSICPDPPLLVFDPASDLPGVPPGTIRIASGPGAGTCGSIDGPPAIHRFDAGTHLLAVPFAGGGRRWMVPLADLERFQ